MESLRVRKAVFVESIPFICGSISELDLSPTSSEASAIVTVPCEALLSQNGQGGSELSL